MAGLGGRSTGVAGELAGEVVQSQIHYPVLAILEEVALVLRHRIIEEERPIRRRKLLQTFYRPLRITRHITDPIQPQLVGLRQLPQMLVLDIPRRLGVPEDTVKEAVDVGQVLLTEHILEFLGVFVEGHFVVFVGGVAGDDDVLGVDVGQVDRGGVRGVQAVGHQRGELVGGDVFNGQVV